MYAATDKVELEARERAMNIQEVVEIVENEHLKGSNRLEQAINLYSKLGYVEKMYKIWIIRIWISFSTEQGRDEIEDAKKNNT